MSRGFFSGKPPRLILLASLALLFAAVFFTEAVVVSRFRRIYEEALPGQQLPALTRCFLHDQMMMIIIAAGLFLAGVWIIYRARIEWLCLIFLAMAAEMGITVVALFMGLNTGIITGMK